MSSSGELFYPYAVQPSGSAAANPFDVTIQKADPGVIYAGTEASAQYHETREVGGDFWIVKNAGWNPNTSTWQQIPPCNVAQPAFASVLTAAGAIVHYYTAATGSASINIAWTALRTFDQVGHAQYTPLTDTGAGVDSLLSPTWNAGAGGVMVAQRTNVTDTSSSVNSLLLDLQVAGASKWSVRKDGTLTTGIVPVANVAGGVALSPGAAQSGFINVTGNITGAIGSFSGISNAAYELFTGTAGAGSAASWMAGAATGLQINVPTGKSLLFSVNGSGVASGTASLWSAPAFALNGTAAASNLMTDGTNLLLRNYSAGGAIYMETSAGGSLAHFPVGGGLVFDTAGAVSGLTSLSMSGALSVGTTGTFSGALSVGTTGTFSGAITANGGIAVADNNSINYGGQAVLRSDGAATIIQPRTAASGTYFQNAASTANNINFPDAGGISLIRGAFSGSGSGLTSIPASALSGNPTFGNVTVTSLTNSGFLQAFSTGVPPVWTPTGGTVAGTVHLVFGTTSVPSGALGQLVTLTGNAVFSTISSYVVIPQGGTSASAFPVGVSQTSGSQFTLFQNSGSTYPIPWVAIGT